MNPASYYRPVDLQLCQGDILDRVPQLYLKDYPGPIRKATTAGNRTIYELQESAPDVQAKRPEEGLLVPAHCQVARAMLLTYDCEIDKDRKHRTVALVRPLPASMPAHDLATIRENRRFAFFCLPAGGDLLPESYVDFRRICTVTPQWVDSAHRLTSLTAVARQAMLLQFFRFLARVELDPAIFGSAE